MTEKTKVYIVYGGSSACRSIQEDYFRQWCRKPGSLMALFPDTYCRASRKDNECWVRNYLEGGGYGVVRRTIPYIYLEKSRKPTVTIAGNLAVTWIRYKPNMVQTPALQCQGFGWFELWIATTIYSWACWLIHEFKLQCLVIVWNASDFERHMTETRCKCFTHREPLWY